MKILFLFFIALMVVGCTSQPAAPYKTVGAKTKTIKKLDFNTPQASGYYNHELMQCVPYARDVSGIQIYGNAHTWWKQAPSYKRGNKPRKGAVLVLSKGKKLRYGHLAVVGEIIGPRIMSVSHTNWGSDYDTRRVVYDRMLVEDISKANDWTLTRFWNKDIDAFGLPYPAHGFIYP